MCSGLCGGKSQCMSLRMPCGPLCTTALCRRCQQALCGAASTLPCPHLVLNLLLV